MLVHLTAPGSSGWTRCAPRATALLETRLATSPLTEREVLAAALPVLDKLMEEGPKNEPKDQPKAVWAVAFACVIAFMGIGLVDPILPVLAQDLDATPSQVSLLFTSYFAITGVSMLDHRVRRPAASARARRCSAA